MPLPLGVFTDVDSAGHVTLPDFAKRLGRDPDEVRGYTVPDRDWQYMLNCLKVAFDIYAGVKQPITWSLGICDTVENVAAGIARGPLTLIFRELLAHAPPTGDIWCRPMWEHTFDGPYKWSSNGREPTWIKAFRNVVTTGWAVSPRFKFEWSPGLNAFHTAADGKITPVDPSKSWPGPYYAHRIAPDLYVSADHTVDPADDIQAWNWKLYGAGYGLDWYAKFAKAWNVPLGFGEFGFGRECPTLAKLLFKWMADNKVHGAYFNATDSVGDWHLFDHPETAKLFVETFGVPQPFWTFGDPALNTIDIAGVRYNIQTAHQPWSWARHEDNNSSRFEVRVGDKWKNDIGRSVNYERSEYGSTFKMTIGKTYWLYFDLCTHGPIAASIPFQVHATEDTGEDPSHAELRFQLSGTSTFRVMTSWVAADGPGAPITEETLFTSNDWVDGKTYRFLVAYQPSGGAPSAIVKVWRDGVKIVDKSGIRAGYPNKIGPYSKKGIYRVSPGGDIGSSALVVEYHNEHGPTETDLTGLLTNPPPLP